MPIKKDSIPLNFADLPNFPKFCLAILLISAFGPYVSVSLDLRVDHLVIYGLLILTIMKELLFPRSRLKVDILIFTEIIFLSCLILWSVIVTAFMDSYLAITNVIADFDNYLQPIALLIISFLLIKELNKHQIEYLAKYLLFLFLILSILNVALSVAFLFFGPGEYMQYIAGSGRGFEEFRGWQSQDIQNIAGLSLLSGRTSGVIAQAYEGGTLYSLSLISWVFLYKERFINNAFFNYFLLGVLLLGGITSGSKAFFFSLPIFFIYLGYIRTVSLILNMRFLIFLSLFLIFMVLLISLYVSNLTQDTVALDRIADFLKRYTNVQNFSILIDMIFGTRSGYIGTSITKVISTFPLHGYGLGSMQTLDSGIVFNIWHGGAVSLLLLVAIILAVFFRFGVALFGQSKEVASFMIYFWIVLSLSTYAGPILFSNRIPIIIWVFLTIFSYQISKQSYSVNIAK